MTTTANSDFEFMRQILSFAESFENFRSNALRINQAEFAIRPGTGDNGPDTWAASSRFQIGFFNRLLK